MHPSKHNIGDIVYPPYKPQRLGIIRDIEPHPNPNVKSWVCVVEYMDGTTGTLSEHVTRDFMRLIEDHRKKLNTHETNLAKVKEHFGIEDD